MFLDATLGGPFESLLLGFQQTQSAILSRIRKYSLRRLTSNLKFFVFNNFRSIIGKKKLYTPRIEKRHWRTEMLFVLFLEKVTCLLIKFSSETNKAVHRVLEARVFVCVQLYSLARCAIAQAVCRRLCKSEARVGAQVRSYGICGGQRGTGAGFLRIIRFSMSPVHLAAPQSATSAVWGWNNRPALWPTYNVYICSSYPKKLKKKPDPPSIRRFKEWLSVTAFLLYI
jgi:hypothetical protein